MLADLKNVNQVLSSFVAKVIDIEEIALKK